MGRQPVLATAIERTSLHAKGCADAQYDEEDSQGGETRMEGCVVPIGNGKYNEDEDKCADKL